MRDNILLGMCVGDLLIGGISMRKRARNDKDYSSDGNDNYSGLSPESFSSQWGDGDTERDGEDDEDNGEKESLAQRGFGTNVREDIIEAMI